MARYKLTHKAASEIETIYRYSILHFGIPTAQHYVSGIHHCLLLLAEHPDWGKPYDFVLPGLQRYEYRSHAVYYRAVSEGILIIRVLGNRQDPARHF